MAATRTKPGRPLPAPTSVKLRGLRQPMAISMPPELVAELDAISAEEGRTRAKQIEFLVREYVQRYRQRAAA